MHRLWHLCYIAAITALMLLLIGFVVVERPSAETADHAVPFQAALIQKTKNFQNVTWLGKPIWQSVLDVWTLQETIFEVKPELIIECGSYKGGSAYFFGNLFDLMGKGRVITVDIEKLHTLSHPRVTYLIGDCASREIIQQIRTERETVTGPVMVILDSDHSEGHVRKEMDAYQSFVTPGSFLHVQDGVIDVLPVFAAARPGPLRAIESFLAEHDEFEVDQARSEKFLITHHPKGWLRRKG
jgi:cephalosporin hydroxylase